MAAQNAFPITDVRFSSEIANQAALSEPTVGYDYLMNRKRNSVANSLVNSALTASNPGQKTHLSLFISLFAILVDRGFGFRVPKLQCFHPVFAGFILFFQLVLIIATLFEIGSILSINLNRIAHI